MTYKRFHKSPIVNRNPGFTLIEVMVAVLVLSVGLLGIASIQATGMRNNHGAYLRSQANIHAYDIIDRMRINKTSALSGADPYTLALSDDPGTPSTNCHSVTCTNIQLSSFDLFEWTQAIANNLPGGDASITKLTVGGRTIFRVIVQWDETRGQSALTNIQIETEI